MITYAIMRRHHSRSRLRSNRILTFISTLLVPTVENYLLVHWPVAPLDNWYIDSPKSAFSYPSHNSQ